MAELYDISNWNLQTWNKPQKGSRPNNIYENPTTGELFYFKLSKANFPSELWSEIIVSKLGQVIGLNLLDYNIGYHNGIIGCLSKSMISKEKNQILYHGVDVLNDNLESFEITDKPIYSFQDLQNLCSQNKNFDKFIENFVELVIFDALIGNTDRHTENWALIFNDDFKLETSKEIKMGVDWLKTLFSILKFKPITYLKSSKIGLTLHHKFEFSQIYDSGSCLGREIAERKIDDYLKDDSKIMQYIQKGYSEIRWHNTQISFFDMVKNVIQEIPDVSKKILSKIIDKATNENVENIVYKIDSNLLDKQANTLLSLQRKELIIRILKHRISKLKDLYTNG